MEALKIITPDLLALAGLLQTVGRGMCMCVCATPRF